MATLSAVILAVACAAIAGGSALVAVRLWRSSGAGRKAHGTADDA